MKIFSSKPKGNPFQSDGARIWQYQRFDLPLGGRNRCSGPTPEQRAAFILERGNGLTSQSSS